MVIENHYVTKRYLRDHIQFLDEEKNMAEVLASISMEQNKIMEAQLASFKKRISSLKYDILLFKKHYIQIRF